MKRTAIVLSLLVAPTLVLYACKKKEPDEEPAPTSKPTVTATATATATATTVVAVESADAGSDDAGDAGDAGPKVGGAPGGLSKCCSALAGNQKSAPPDQALFYGAAIAICNAAKNSPSSGAVVAQIRAALHGASLPSSCQ